MPEEEFTTVLQRGMEHNSVSCNNYAVYLKPSYHQIHELNDISRNEKTQRLRTYRRLHANCSRNRTSPENSSPISLTPYFIIAMRSRPMPKAKPEIFSGL